MRSRNKTRTINSFLADPRSEIRKIQLQTLEKFVIENSKKSSTISFVKYWGGSDKQEMDKYDFDSILMLFGFIKTIERKYNVYINLTIIFTDTHALLNGYEEENFMTYFSQIRHALNSFNFHHEIMSEILNPYAKSKGFKNSKSIIEDMITNSHLIDKYLFSSNGVFKNFEHSAKKYSKRIIGTESNPLDKPEVAAKLYLFLNDIERKLVAKQFKNSFFVTYVSEEEQKLTIPNLPSVQIYSYKRGIRSRPWFLTSK